MMSLRAFSILLVLLATPSFQLRADPVTPIKVKERLQTEETVQDIGTEKTEELQTYPVKSNHFIEFRPTYTPLTGEFRTENLFELAYKLNPQLKVSYVQYFNTNLYNAVQKKNIFQKPGFAWQDGFLRLKISDLWRSVDKKTSFSVQERLYLPIAPKNDTFPSRINQGMITIFRSYFSIAHRFSDRFANETVLAPSFFIFKRSGFDTDKKMIANPVYETLLSHSLEFKVSDSIQFILPFVFRMTLKRDYSPKAAENNSWAYNLSTFPEIDWTLNSTHTVGASFGSDNILTGNGAGTDWGHAFEHGVVQAFWNVKF